MATDLTKYQRYNDDILERTKTNTAIKKKVGRKSAGLTHKVTINITDQEMQVLSNMHSNTGTPIATIIRRALIKSGIFIH
ncbi:hypothetical protein [Rickettsia asembonensis]|uniref:hypothetical protein n=1 Tax=Rickettsia asembonensis TaxID=1068590 RepID=UPI0023F63966|nr:hypothetical protein [Rickettsia asembonensis]WCR55974.1 MAG: hypothetical protein PG979_000031 [Rickettsia asembonensis]